MRRKLEKLSLKGLISGRSLGRRHGKPRLAGRYRMLAKHRFGESWSGWPAQWPTIVAASWTRFGLTILNSSVFQKFRGFEPRTPYWVKDEYYHSGRTEDEIADFVASQQFQRVYPDPESASGIAMLRKKGVNVREVKKGKDSITSGIQKLRELFKANRIHIHKKCVNLISELETYSYPDKKDQRNADELPIKEHDHLLDALRYAIVTNETTRQANAPVYYAQSSMPIDPMKGAPPLPNQPKRIATTYIPRL